MLAGCAADAASPEIRATIFVPPEAQSAFASHFPAELLVADIDADPPPDADLHGDRVAVLCDPQAHDLVVDVHLERPGCASPRRVVAWLARTTDASACGVLAHPEPASAALAPDAPRGAAAVFRNADPEACEALSDEAQVVLGPAP